MRPGLGIALVWLAVTTSCGGGSGSGAVAASGVSANKKIASLGDGEIKKLCEWSNELSETPLSDEEICTYDSLLANSSAECEQQRDACLKKIAAGMTPGLLGVRAHDCAQMAETVVPTGCNATVEALEHCHRDLIDAMVADAMLASCDKLGMLWTKAPASCPKNVLVCTQLITQGGD